jgi:nitronate monooxygenase
MSSARFTDLLDVRYPIIQAPMAGGGDTPELVAAVGNAEAIGFIGAAYLTPEQIASTAASVKERTLQPFGINLFAPVAKASKVGATLARQRVKPYYEELGIPMPEHLEPPEDGFEAQLDAVLKSGARCLSFTFGHLPSHAIALAKSSNMVVMGTATTVSEAIELE